MTAAQICDAVTRGPFSRRRYLAVPNVSWGWGLDYEADIIVVSPSRWAQEIEIKISKSDLLADKAKQKFRAGLNDRIKHFYYAVPTELVDVALAEIDPRYGIIEVREPQNSYDFRRAYFRRRGTRLPSRQCSETEVNDLLRLGYLRYWDLRDKQNGKGNQE